MLTEDGYVVVPPRLAEAMRKPRKGKRVYRASGGIVAFQKWIRLLTQEMGSQVIPESWVADYVGVSRVAVWKKQVKGELTTFIFAPNKKLIPYIGKSRNWVREEFACMSLEECERWRKIMEQRGKRHSLGHR
jgi:hypothetical protein